MAPYQKTVVAAFTANPLTIKERLILKKDNFLLSLGARLCKDEYKGFIKNIEEILPHIGGGDETEWFPSYRSLHVFKNKAQEDDFLIKAVSKQWTAGQKNLLNRQASQLTRVLKIKAISAVTTVTVVTLISLAAVTFMAT